MPLYDFKCPSGHKFERMVKLQDFEVPQFCDCGESATRVISAPLFSVESVGYSCPVTGNWIGSKRDHENNLDRTGCRVLETGETEAKARERAAGEVAFDRGIEETVEREFEAMSSAKKEKIANELMSGVDLAVERK